MVTKVEGLADKDLEMKDILVMEVCLSYLLADESDKVPRDAAAELKEKVETLKERTVNAIEEEELIRHRAEMKAEKEGAISNIEEGACVAHEEIKEVKEGRAERKERKKEKKERKKERKLIEEDAIVKECKLWYIHVNSSRLLTDSEFFWHTQVEEGVLAGHNVPRDEDLLFWKEQIWEGILKRHNVPDEVIIETDFDSDEAQE